MIIVVATIRVKPDCVAPYESAIRDIMPRVRAANPDLLFYRTGRCREEAGTYRVIEAYASQAAMQAHMDSALLQEVLAPLIDLVESIDIKLHDELETG